MQVLTTAPSPLSPQGTEEAHLATQLLEALLGAPLLPLVTKHSELLEPLWRAVATDGSLAQDDAPDEDDDDEAAPPSTARALGAASARRGGGAGGRRGSAVPGVRGGRSARRGLLLGFLKVYGACETLPKLSGAAALYADCARLLGHADHKVQSAALECIARWSQPAVNKYKAQLLGLISEKSFRETLALFPVDERQDDAMLPQHRPIVLPLLTRLLYARLTQRGGRGASKNAMAQRRATIFAFFCSYHPHELRPLVDLILAPMARVGATSSDGGDAGAQRDADAQRDAGAQRDADALARGAALAAVPPGQQLGVLRSLHEALAQLGGALAPYLPELLATLRHLLLYATHCVCFASPIAGFAAGGDDEDGDGDDAYDGEDGDGGAPTVAPTTAPTTARNAEEGALLPPSAHLGASVRAVLTLVEAREARLWVIKAWSIVMQAFPSAPLAPTAALFFRCVRPMLERLHTPCLACKRSPQRGDPPSQVRPPDARASSHALHAVAFGAAERARGDDAAARDARAPQARGGARATVRVQDPRGRQGAPVRRRGGPLDRGGAPRPCDAAGAAGAGGPSEQRPGAHLAGRC